MEAQHTKKDSITRTPDSTSAAPVAQKERAQVPTSLPVPKLYPPLEYPPLDIETPDAPLPTPSPSPPTNINTPPLSPSVAAPDDDSCPQGQIAKQGVSSSVMLVPRPQQQKLISGQQG